VDLTHSRLTHWFTSGECVQYLHQETCPGPPIGTGLAEHMP
jgi:hypothetical protein